MDFEIAGILDGLGRSGFDRQRRTVFSRINTLPYLSAAAIESTLRDIALLSAEGSRLVLNYDCDVPLSDAQADHPRSLRESGHDLEGRYFAGRKDELAPTTPVRLVVAERVGMAPFPDHTRLAYSRARAHADEPHGCCRQESLRELSRPIQEPDP